MPSAEQGFFSRYRWLATALAVVVAVVLLASFVSRRDDSIPVRTATTTRGIIRSVISTNGKIEPAQNFEAHAPVATTVKRVLIHEGDHVKKGQLLLQLDDADARSQAARAMAQMKAAQRNLQAMQSLEQKGAASAGEVREAENALKRADAELNLLQQKQKDRYSQPEVARVEAQKSEAQAAHDAAEDVLAKSNLQAPFDGIVYALAVRQGVFVQAGD